MQIQRPPTSKETIWRSGLNFRDTLRNKENIIDQMVLSALSVIISVLSLTERTHRYSRGQTDTQTHDHNTFRVVCDSREM